MKHKPLPVGVENFEKLITRGYYFIDKTLFIRELLDKKGDVNLFTRPRRFGKTLSLSMLQYFFEDDRDGDGNRRDHSSLFEGMNIMKAGKTYLSDMGQHPVISLSLKSGCQPDFDMAYKSLISEVQKEFQRHKYILGGLDGVQRQKFELIRAGEAERIDYAKSLDFLSRCLEAYHGSRTIILIDEYDVPLENAFTEGFYKEMADFIRSLLESALKTNSSLEFGVITGCLRISKESIFTGMNHLKINSIMSGQFGEYFGFTDGEIREMCDAYGLPEKYDAFKDWYNGYTFGRANVYNPWSVVMMMDRWVEDGQSLPCSFWANTSSNSIVRKLIDLADEETKKEIEGLIEGKTVTKPIHEDITYDEVYDTMDNLWNFMFFTGYFKKVREWMDDEDQHYVELMIPNREVKYIFRTKVLSWFEEKVKERDRQALFKAFLDRDVDAMETEIAGLLMDTISFNDAYESFYHGFLAGILSGMKGYMVKSNRESGHGRSDLFVMPVSRRKPAYVIEFKIASKIGELERKAQEAIRQIEEKKYIAELNCDGYDTVYKYGIAFLGKDCLVRLQE